ncbi:MAG TPA: HEAT repeat domain-containing protein [Ktedonobacterales bacterium]
MASGAGRDEKGYWGPDLPKQRAPEWVRREFIERGSDLAPLAEAMAHSRHIAIDAEFAQPKIRHPGELPHKLSLLQIAPDTEPLVSWVVDALRISDLMPLASALENPRIVKLFHGVGSDTRVLATRGLTPVHVIDLEAASRTVFGPRESGLQAMLKRSAGVYLDKSFQRADWARRPLEPAMVTYAAQDAEMTLILYTWLAQHFPWALNLFETTGEPPRPPVAGWIAPLLEGRNAPPVEVAVADAGLDGNTARQIADLRAAMGAVSQPVHRARLMRIASELDLSDLLPDIRAFASAQPAEERAAAARAFGRLRDRTAVSILRAMLEDPVFDVRSAAAFSLESMGEARPAAPARPAPRGARPADQRVWVTGDTPADGDDGDWRARLRQHFGGEKPGD